MASVRDCIKGAMKKLAVLAIGREPTAAQGEDALVAIQALYRELIGLGTFGRLRDVLVQTDTYDAREGERVVCDNAAGVAVTLPKVITQALISAAPYCCDRYWVDTRCDYGFGMGSATLPRPPYDGACIVIADTQSSFEKYYLYDANRACWVLLDDLTLDSIAPLSGRYENGLKALLALRLADTYGRQPSPLLSAEANTFRYALSHKWDRGSRVASGEYF